MIGDGFHPLVMVNPGTLDSEAHQVSFYPLWASVSFSVKWRLGSHERLQTHLTGGCVLLHVRALEICFSGMAPAFKI